MLKHSRGLWRMTKYQQSILNSSVLYSPYTVSCIKSHGWILCASFVSLLIYQGVYKILIPDAYFKQSCLITSSNVDSLLPDDSLTCFLLDGHPTDKELIGCKLECRYEIRVRDGTIMQITLIRTGMLKMHFLVHIAPFSDEYCIASNKEVSESTRLSPSSVIQVLGNLNLLKGDGNHFITSSISTITYPNEWEDTLT